MTPMRRPPWSAIPLIDWDEHNLEHIAQHGVTQWEIEEILLLCGYDVRPHKKRKKQLKFENRYVVTGQTLGGRNLAIFIDVIGLDHIRPVTAF